MKLTHFKPVLVCYWYTDFWLKLKIILLITKYFDEIIIDLQWSLQGIPIFLTWTPCWVYAFEANVNHTWAKVWIQTRNNEQCNKTNQKMNLWITVSYQINSKPIKYLSFTNFYICLYNWNFYINAFSNINILSKKVP